MKDKSKKEVSKDTPTELSEKKQALEAVFSQIDKQYGKGSVMLLGQTPVAQVKSISTGSILVNQAIGVGGLPKGRVIEVFGPESSGKTTIALQVIAEAQKAGGICAFIDAEHALDTQYAKKLGINVDDLIISQPDYGEQALDISEMLVRSNAIDVIVVDSVAALVPKSELEGDMGDVHMGLQARLMSQALRKLTPIVHKSNIVFIFINQTRQNIGGMAFANKEVTTGGNALKFYSSLRLEVRRVESLKKSDVHFGNRVAIKVVKNKMAPPFKRVIVDLIFGQGISKELELLDLALNLGVVKQAGSWFSLGNEKIGQGRDQVSQLLKTNNELAQKVNSEVHSILELNKQKQNEANN